MPYPSFFLGAGPTFIAFIAFLSVVYTAPTFTTTASYTLQTTYAGSTFFEGFTFFDEADPTRGFVTYVNQSEAQNMGLISAADGGAVRIGVDHTKKYDGTKPYWGINGVGRPSVRIATNQKYNHGLFIADIAHMPGGVCGTWPALWTLGDGTWPYHGEVDIIEGVHTQEQVLSALHTTGRCNVPSFPSSQTGVILNTNCTFDTVHGTNAQGCSVLSSDTDSFGLPFNAMGGGVFAWEWTSSSIRSWFFRRDAIPLDITSGKPVPSNWGKPYVNFQGDCDIDSNFINHQIVLDTTFCGEFAGAVWNQSCAASTGVSSCSVYVGDNPSAFRDMYWLINSIKVYSNESAVITPSNTKTTMSTTATSSLTSTTTSTTSTSSTTTTTASSLRATPVFGPPAPSSIPTYYTTTPSEPWPTTADIITTRPSKTPTTTTAATNPLTTPTTDPAMFDSTTISTRGGQPYI